MKTSTLLSITGLALGLTFATAIRADGKKHDHHDQAAAPAKGEKAKPYPLKTCLVSGDKLGEMGDPFVFVKDGQGFKTCCKSCKKDIDKDPKKFLTKLAEEVKKLAEAKEKK